METKHFSLMFYFKTLSAILGNPRDFFKNLSPEMGLQAPMIFLIISGLVFTFASLMNTASDPLITGFILFINAVGMVFLASGLGYMVMIMTIGKQASYKQFFTIYALSSGVTLLASWLPFFLIITEPWKWWLINTGMTKTLNLKWTQSLLIISISFAVIILFVWSAMLLPKI